MLIRLNKYDLFIKINIIVTIVVMISCVYIWIYNSQSLVSSLMFFGIVYLFFNIALSKNIDKSENYIKILAFASLLMFLGLLYVALVAITQDDTMVIENREGFYFKKRRK